MSIPPCWHTLSADEKADCTGDLRSFTCCSRYVWDVRGILDTDWKDRIQPQLNSLIDHNYKQVFGKRGVQALLSLHLYLVCPTADSAAAVPIIYIRTRCRKTASRARRLIVNHDIFKNMNTNFDVLYEGKSIFWMAGGTNANLPQSRGTQSLCGASIVVVPVNDQTLSERRYATIFCTIQFGKQYFAVLPAHVFFPEVTRTIEDDDEYLVDATTYSDSEHNVASTSEYSSDGDSSGDHLNQHSEQGSIEAEFEWPPPHRVYLNSTYGPNNSVEMDSVLLGTFDPRQQLGPATTFSSLCYRLDYALVELKDFAFNIANIIFDTIGNRVNVERYDTEVSSTTALLASGSHDTQELSVSNTASTLLLPRSDKSLKVWELVYSLPSGDSGSPMLTPNGVLLGMAVATIPDHQITYIVPASEIFEHIWTTMSSSIDAHEAEQVSPLSLLQLNDFASTRSTGRPSSSPKMKLDDNTTTGLDNGSGERDENELSLGKLSNYVPDLPVYGALNESKLELKHDNTDHENVNRPSLEQSTKHPYLSHLQQPRVDHTLVSDHSVHGISHRLPLAADENNAQALSLSECVTDQLLSQDIPKKSRELFGPSSMDSNLVQYKLWNDGHTWKMTIQSESYISDLTMVMLTNNRNIDSITNLRGLIDGAEQMHIQNLLNKLNARDCYIGRWTVPTLSLLFEKDESQSLLFFIVRLSNQQSELPTSHPTSQSLSTRRTGRHPNTSKAHSWRAAVSVQLPTPATSHFSSSQLPTPAPSHISSSQWATPQDSHTSTETVCAYCKSRGRTVRVVPGGICYKCRSRC